MHHVHGQKNHKVQLNAKQISRTRQIAAWVTDAFSPASFAREIADAAKPITQTGRPSIFRLLLDDVKTMISEIRHMSAAPSKPRETFDELVARLGLGPRQLREIEAQARRAARLMLAMAIALLFALGFVLSFGHFAPVTKLGLGVTTLTAIVGCMHANWRAWQVVHRQLCSMSEWIRDPARWFV